MKEEEYLLHLKQELRILRRQCLDFIRDTLEMKPTLQMQRDLGRGYGLLHPVIPKEHLDLDWPQPAGTSYVDAYHQSFFIRATLAALYEPNVSGVKENISLAGICTVGKTELQAREAQLIISTALADKIKERGRTNVQTEKHEDTQRDWRIGLKEDVQQIRAGVQHLILRLCPEDEAMGPGGDQLRQLPAEKRKSRPRKNSKS